jgi:hypothetical protein
LTDRQPAVVRQADPQHAARMDSDQHARRLPLMPDENRILATSPVVFGVGLF